MAAPGTLNLDVPPTWGARTIDAFEKLEQIGEGTYGTVFMAREKATGDVVALKKVRMDNEKEGFPITAIREIKILKKLKHENIVNLKEIVTSKADAGSKSKGGIFMVFEYMDHDLAGLADRGIRFSIPQIKCYMRQMLQGLHFCHVNKVLHRDIKGSNILINNSGILKIADFGLARSYTVDQGKLTNKVITLWYRPPELLMGALQYGPEVDMWSVGCIFAELLTGKAILPGKSELEQLNLIFQLCGTPDETSWPGYTKLPYFQTARPERPIKRCVREQFKNLDKNALELLDKMLELNPAKRISAAEALDSNYFWVEPLPADPASLPKYEPSHEYQTKKRRQQQRQGQEEAKRRASGHPPPYPHSRGPPAAYQSGAGPYSSRGPPGGPGGSYGPPHGQAYYGGSGGRSGVPGDGPEGKPGRTGHAAHGGYAGPGGYAGSQGGYGASGGRAPPPRPASASGPHDRDGRASQLMPPPPPPGQRGHRPVPDGRPYPRKDH